MGTLVVYYSHSGNTGYIAETIRQAVNADVISLIPEKAYPQKGFQKFFWGGKSAVMAETPKLQKYDLDAAKYDTVVIGFPVWAGTIAPPIRTFVSEQGNNLSGKKILAYACQSGAGGEKALEKLRVLLGIPSFSATMILNDPKDKPDAATEAKLEQFLMALQKEQEVTEK